MIGIKKQNDAYLIEDKILFGIEDVENLKDDVIGLALVKGEDMRYDSKNTNFLAYPGEYDIMNTKITCLLGKNDKLNYLIELESDKIGIIQSKEVLEQDIVSDMDYWLFVDEIISSKIDEYEMEGQKVNLNSYNG